MADEAEQELDPLARGAGVEDTDAEGVATEVGEDLVGPRERRLRVHVPPGLEERAARRSAQDGQSTRHAAQHGQP